MKKLALLLAAALLFGCCLALASCGESEEIEDTSSASSSAAASSEAGSSEAESSAAVSSEAESSQDETSSEETADTSSDDTTSEPRTFWLTHFSDGSVEGAGSIFLGTDTAGPWWLHVAFQPVEGQENVYEIVEISNGITDGTAVVVSVPADGFVYALNLGNDYPSINPDGSGIDYTSTACNTMIEDAKTWAVGDQIRFTGLDLENMTIPTSTPDTNWYEEDYVCTATWEFAN